MRQEIIDYIKRNRVSTAQVGDCLGKTGVVEGVCAVNRGHFCVGEVRWTYAYDESNWTVHEGIVDTRRGEVVFIDAFDCEDRAVAGELVAKYVLLYRQAEAIVSTAKFRDAAALIRENYPIWNVGFNPVGCFNNKIDHPLDPILHARYKARYDGAIAVCDDCGVVMIPKEQHTAEFLQKLMDIKKQEDTWFHRLDHTKENTYEIVCLKQYLDKEQEG